MGGEGFEVGYYRKYFSMNTLRVRLVKILNFKNARLLLSAVFLRGARALTRPSSIKFWGVGINTSEDRRIFPDLSQYVLC